MKYQARVSLFVVTVKPEVCSLSVNTIGVEISCFASWL